MTNLIELFPVLGDCELKAEDPRWALLEAPSFLEGARPIRHPAFRDVSSRLFSAVKGSPLTLLIGASGVGKTRLVLSLVQRLNGLLARPGRIPAIALVAPTSQRNHVLLEGVLGATADSPGGSAAGGEGGSDRAGGSFASQAWGWADAAHPASRAILKWCARPPPSGIWRCW